MSLMNPAEHWQRLRRFLGEDLWTGRPGAAARSDVLHGPWWINWLRVAFLVWRGFVKNRCPVRAAALAYTTLLGLIPVLAITFILSSRFLNFDRKTAELVPRLLQNIVEYLAPPLKELPPPPAAEPGAGELAPDAAATEAAPESDPQPGAPAGPDPPPPGEPVARQLDPAAAQEVVAYIQGFIDQISSGRLGLFGTFLLIFVAISLLTNIEHAFNEIFGARQGRSFLNRIIYYWAVITLFPLILFVAYTITSGFHLPKLDNPNRAFLLLERAYFFFLPFFALWLMFALLYWGLPNTHIRFRAALVGGVIGGSLWQFNNMASTLYISKVLTYSKIYGSLGAVPVLLFGIYLSWLIILLGAQVTSAAQNLRAYADQIRSAGYDEETVDGLALWALLRVCETFCRDRGEPPPNARQLAQEAQVPEPLLEEILDRLAGHRIVVRTEFRAGHPAGYHPGRDPGRIFPGDALAAMQTSPRSGPPLLAVRESPAGQITWEIHQRINAARHEVGSQRSYREIVAEDLPQAAARNASPHPERRDS